MAAEKQAEIVLWTPHKNQKKILKSKKRYKVIVCGRQFGKTTYAINYLLEEALANPGHTYWYVAPTYKQAKMIAWGVLQASLDKVREGIKASGQKADAFIKTNESELYVIFANKARIEIKGADNPDTLRGVALHGAVLDEYAFMRENVFTEIILPMFNTTNGWTIFISTPKGFNHFHTLYIDAKGKEDWETYHFTSYDNPYASNDVIEEARLSMSPDRFAQEYLADFRKAEGLVYKDFDRDTHVVSDEKWKDKQWIEVIAGIDFGYTNPSSIIVIGRDFDNTFFVIEEWYARRKSTAEVAEKAKQLQEKHSINIFYPDPANPAHIEEITRLGVPTRETSKDIVKGVDAVADLLATRRLFIDSRCKTLIQEFETYSYPEKHITVTTKDRSEPEKPVKENDHGLDALRYALFSNQPIQKEDKTEMNLYAQDFS